MTITEVQLEEALALRDLSDESQGPHAMQLLLAAVLNEASKTVGSCLRLERRSPLVSVSQNYDALLIPANTVTRDARYTRYVDTSTMLRSHTSAHLPGLLAAYDAKEEVSDLIAVPGLVYRRDQIDRTHVGEPHQLDLWQVTSHEPKTRDDLLMLMKALVRAVLPGARWRTIEAEHSYAVQGLQLEVQHGGEWLELAEGGLIHPRILANAGLPDWSGLALGMGLDRALMLRKRIDDIRYLRSSLPAALSQLQDLQLWRKVSHQPAARRDISVMVDAMTDEEILGDQIRQALGREVESLEAVTIRARTPYEVLPEAARLRMGGQAGQDNVLVRLILRSLDHTLSSDEANVLRDCIYRAVHVGKVSEIDGNRMQ